MDGRHDSTVMCSIHECIILLEIRTCDVDNCRLDTPYLY